MRTAVTITRILVGVLFIVSGLVKANDPLGLAYKMEEFFEVWNTSLAGSGFFAKDALVGLFNFLHGYALGLSVIMIALEIIAGAALLLGWRKRFVLLLLLILIIFFTFLTAYAYWSGKFKNCGCFGDCLPISPFASFLKDLVLLVCILFLLRFQKYIAPVFASRTRLALLVATVFFSFGFQWFVLKNLPVVDCLPFKIGAHIPTQMQMPPNAVPDSFAMKFIYEKEGKRYEFAPENLPADLASYKFIDREQKLVRKGNAEPAIKGFSLTATDGNILTDAVLTEQRAVLLFALHFNNANDWMGEAKELYAAAKRKNIPFFVVTSDVARGRMLFGSAGLGEVVFLSADNTAVRTAARANPTVYVLEKGTVKYKRSGRSMHRVTAQL